ncbi:hypothetical protein C0J52_20229 [Blattella germanica]|nr:hypothetical protein C0J52_20229 [Blattella germanica]
MRSRQCACLHFRSGVGGDSKVSETAQEILQELDQLAAIVKEQCCTLESCIAQVDQYQQQLRQQIVQVEQQLRVVLSPTYSPHDRDKAMEEQNGLHRSMDSYREQIQALMDQIHQVDPYMVIIPEKLEQGNGNGQLSPTSSADVNRRHQKISQQSAASCIPLASPATYADIAAGRTSPCPFVEQNEEKVEKMKNLPKKTRTIMDNKDVAKQDTISIDTTSIENKFEDRKDDAFKIAKPHEVKTSEIHDKTHETGSISVKVQIEESQTSETQATRGEKARPSRRGRSQQRKVVHERKHPEEKLHSHNPKASPEALSNTDSVEVNKSQDLQLQHSTREEKKHHHVILKQPQETLKPHVQRGRSPSPMWNPGSTSYADILRGRQPTESHEEAVGVAEVLSQQKCDDEIIEDKYQHYQQENWNLPSQHETISSPYQPPEDVYVAPPVDESSLETVENYEVDQGSRVDKIQASESEQFLQEEVITADMTVPPGIYEYIQQPPPDLVGFIASGQQLLNSGLGTYHSSAHSYVMGHDSEQAIVYPVTATQTEFETMTIDSSHYVQASIEPVPYTTPVHEDIVSQQFDLSQQTLLSEQDVASSPDITPVHSARRSKKIKAGHPPQTEAIAVVAAAEDLNPAPDQQMPTSESEMDKCHLSYAQILVQGLCAKPLQPVGKNDRSQSSRPMSPISSCSREWSASPYREIPSTAREEVTKFSAVANGTNTRKVENKIQITKKKENQVKKEMDSPKPGKIKQKKKSAMPSYVEEIPAPSNESKQLLSETETIAAGKFGEPVTEIIDSKPVADSSSLVSVKVKKSPEYKKAVDAQPVSQISPDNSITIEVIEEIEGTEKKLNTKDDDLTDQVKKKKKPEKSASEDEIEKALKEIAKMEITQNKHRTKNTDTVQDAKQKVAKPDKDEKKPKKIKAGNNANPVVHKTGPNQMATVISSDATSIVEVQESPEVEKSVANEGNKPEESKSELNKKHLKRRKKVKKVLETVNASVNMKSALDDSFSEVTEVSGLPEKSTQELFLGTAIEDVNGNNPKAESMEEFPPPDLLADIPIQEAVAPAETKEVMEKDSEHVTCRTKNSNKRCKYIVVEDNTKDSDEAIVEAPSFKESDAPESELQKEDSVQIQVKSEILSSVGDVIKGKEFLDKKVDINENKESNKGKITNKKSKKSKQSKTEENKLVLQEISNKSDTDTCAVKPSEDSNVSITESPSPVVVLPSKTKLKKSKKTKQAQTKEENKDENKKEQDDEKVMENEVVNRKMQNNEKIAIFKQTEILKEMCAIESSTISDTAPILEEPSAGSEKINKKTKSKRNKKLKHDVSKEEKPDTAIGEHKTEIEEHVALEKEKSEEADTKQGEISAKNKKSKKSKKPKSAATERLKDKTEETVVLPIEQPPLEEEKTVDHVTLSTDSLIKNESINTSPVTGEGVETNVITELQLKEIAVDVPEEKLSDTKASIDESVHETAVEEHAPVDVPKLKRRDTKKKARRITNVQSSDIVVASKKENGHEETLDATTLLASSSAVGKETPQVTPVGTTTDLDTVVLTPQWMSKSPPSLNIKPPSKFTFDPSLPDPSKIVDIIQKASDVPPVYPPQSVTLLTETVSPNLGTDVEEIKKAEEGKKTVPLNDKQITIQLGDGENSGIFGSVKERTKKPRKIIDTMTSDEKAVKLSEDSASSLGILSAGVKSEAEKVKTNDDEEYALLKEKMKKKKRRPKIPVEFLKDAEEKKTEELKIEEVKKVEEIKMEEVQKTKEEEEDKSKEDSKVEKDKKRKETSTTEPGIKELMESAKTEEKTASPNVAPATETKCESVEVITKEYTGVVEGQLSASSLKPTDLRDAWMSALDEPMLFDDEDDEVEQPMAQEEKKSEIIETVNTANIQVPETSEKPESSTAKKQTDMSDAWMTALDEPMVFDDDEKEEDDKMTPPAIIERENLKSDITESVSDSKYKCVLMENESMKVSEVSEIAKQDTEKEKLVSMASCVMKSDELSDEWLHALEEPMLFSDDEEEESETALVTRSELESNVNRTSTIEITSDIIEIPQKPEKNIDDKQTSPEVNVTNKVPPELAPTELNALDEPTVFNGKSIIQNLEPSLQNAKDPFSDHNIANERSIAKLIAEDLNPNYFIYRDAEIHWQEKIAQQTRNVPLSPVKTDETSSKMEECLKSEPLDNLKINLSIEGHPYDTGAINEAEKMWQELKASSEKEIRHAKNITLNFSNEYEYCADIQEVSPCDLVQNIDRTSVTEPFSKVSEKSVEFPARIIEKCEETPDMNAPPDNILSLEEKQPPLKNELPAESKSAPLKSEENDNSQVIDDINDLSLVTEKRSINALANMSKENIWLDSSKFLDAEKNWQELQSRRICLQEESQTSVQTSEGKQEQASSSEQNVILAEKITKEMEIDSKNNEPVLKPEKTDEITEQLPARDEVAERLFIQYDSVGIHNAEQILHEQVARDKIPEKGIDVKEEPVVDNLSKDHGAENMFIHYDVPELNEAEKNSQEEIGSGSSELPKTDVLTVTTETTDQQKSKDHNSEKLYSQINLPEIHLAEKQLQEKTAKCSASEVESKSVENPESPEQPVKTWANIVGSKKSESPLEDKTFNLTIPSKPCLMAEKSVVKEISSTVTIQVDEVEEESVKEPVVQVDPEGFMEFVPRKEMRKRKSRSRSRSRCRDPIQNLEKPETAVDDASFEHVPLVSQVHEMSVKEPVAAEEDVTEDIVKKSKSEKEIHKLNKKSKTNEERAKSKGQQYKEKSPIPPTFGVEGKGKKKLSESEKEVEDIVRSLEREYVLQYYLPSDGAFWPEKWQYHDAERQWQELLAQSKKKLTNAKTDTNSNPDETHDRKDDFDGGSSGHSSPGPHTPRGGGGGGGLGSSAFTEQLSTDLPGGICSWRDESTYLSGPLVCASNSEILLAMEEEEEEEDEDHASRLAHRVAEEVITDLDDEDPFYPFSPAVEVQPCSSRTDVGTAVFLAQMKKLSEELQKREQDAIKLENVIRDLSTDAETQSLEANLAGVRTRIVTLVSQVEQGKTSVELARGIQDKRHQEVQQYQVLLTDVEKWLNTVKATLSTDLDSTSPKDIQDQLLIYEKLSQELVLKEAKLLELTEHCQRLQEHPDVSELAATLLLHLKMLQETIHDSSKEVKIRQEFLLSGEKQPVEHQQQRVLELGTPVQPSLPLETEDLPHSQLSLPREEKAPAESSLVSIGDNTIASDASPIPDEEVMPQSPIPADFVILQEPGVIEVGSQTGNSLIFEHPKKETVITEVETKDIGISCHPPVDMQVQTELSSKSEIVLAEKIPAEVAIQTVQDTWTSPAIEMQKKKIHVLQKVTGDEETIEIATKSGLMEEKPENPDDLLVEVKFKGKGTEESATSELNIIHTAPQSFETMMINPDETTTEVIVDKDGNQQINIVRRMRRTVISQQQTIQQRHETFTTTELGKDDVLVPVTQSIAFSQVTLQGQTSTFATSQGDGKMDVTTSSAYTGHIAEGVPGGAVTVSEFSSEPQHQTVTYHTSENLPASALLLRGLQPQHENDQDYSVEEPPEENETTNQFITTSTSSVQAVVKQQTRKIIRRIRRVIRKVEIIDGKEHVTEEVIEEPEEVEEEVPRVTVEISSFKEGNEMPELRQFQGSNMPGPDVIQTLSFQEHGDISLPQFETETQEPGQQHLSDGKLTMEGMQKKYAEFMQESVVKEDQGPETIQKSEKSEAILKPAEDKVEPKEGMEHEPSKEIEVTTELVIKEIELAGGAQPVQPPILDDNTKSDEPELPVSKKDSDAMPTLEKDLDKEAEVKKDEIEVPSVKLDESDNVPIQSSTLEVKETVISEKIVEDTGSRKAEEIKEESVAEVALPVDKTISEVQLYTSVAQEPKAKQKVISAGPETSDAHGAEPESVPVVTGDVAKLPDSDYVVQHDIDSQTSPEQGIKTVVINIALEEKHKSLESTEEATVPKLSTTLKIDENIEPEKSLDHEVVKEEIMIDLPVSKSKTQTAISHLDVSSKPLKSEDDVSSKSERDSSGSKKGKKKNKGKTVKESSLEESVDSGPVKSLEEKLEEEASVATSLAESTEIIVAGSESSSDTTKPTEQEIAIFETPLTPESPKDSDKTYDTGYDAEEKTFEDLSLTEEDKKKKRKKKKKSKVRGKKPEELSSAVPQSSTEPLDDQASSDISATEKHDTELTKEQELTKQDEATPVVGDDSILEDVSTKRKARKRKHDKKGDGDSEHPGEPLVEGVEETLTSRPGSEVDSLINARPKSVEVWELVQVHEQEAQTLTPDTLKVSEIATTETSMQTIQDEAPFMEDDGMQTENNDLIKAETTDLSVQTNKDDLTPTQEKSSQTKSPAPEKEKATIETSAQTASPRPQEQYAQTAMPETDLPIDTADSSIQTRTQELQESSMQTISPEIPIVETVESSSQTRKEEESSQETVDRTKKTDTFEISIQTLKEEITPVSEECTQTLTPEAPAEVVSETVEMSSQTAKEEPVSTVEGSVQTVSPEVEETIQVNTSDSSIQTVKEDILPTEAQAGASEIPTQEESSQTSATDITSVTETQSQTIKEEIIPTDEQFSQTTGIVMETADFSIQTSKEDLTPTLEVFSQTSPPLLSEVEVKPESGASHVSLQLDTSDKGPSKLEKKIEVLERPAEQVGDIQKKETVLPSQKETISIVTRESSIQTKPVLVREFEDRPQSSSSDEPYEIHVQTSVSFMPSNIDPVRLSYDSAVGSSGDRERGDVSSHEGTKISKQFFSVGDTLEVEEISTPSKHERPQEVTRQITYMPGEEIKPIITEIKSPVLGVAITSEECVEPTVSVTLEPGKDIKKAVTDFFASEIAEEMRDRETKEAEKKKTPTPEAAAKRSGSKEQTRKEKKAKQKKSKKSREPIQSGKETDESQGDASGSKSLSSMDVSTNEDTSSDKPLYSDIAKHAGKPDDHTEERKMSGHPVRGEHSPGPPVIFDDSADKELGNDTGSKMDLKTAQLQQDSLLQKTAPTLEEPSDFNIGIMSEPQGIEDSTKSIPQKSSVLIRVHSSQSSDDVMTPSEETTAVEWNKANSLLSKRTQDLQNARKTTHMGGILCLATLQEVATEEPLEQRSEFVQHNLNLLRSAVEKKDILVIQQTVITTVETISTWLETIEYRVYLNRQKTSAAPTQEQLKEFGGLKQEINHIEENVGALGSVLDSASEICNDDDKLRIKQCIASLQEHMKAVEEITQESEEKAASDLSRWEEFLNGVNNISVMVEELKQKLDELIESDTSAQAKLEELDEIEALNRCHMGKTARLINTARNLIKEFPGREIPPETNTANETSKIIDHSVSLERERLLHLLSLVDDYEQTLKELSQIIDVADFLVESPISVISLEHLQEEMQKHRKFFVNLSHCRGILESLERNLDPETRALHSELHQTLHCRATAILDKAASRAQQMALAASRWTVLEQGMKEERGWLQVAHQRVPDLQCVNSSDYDQYISMYQSLSSDVAVHHARIVQLLGIAHRLQELVTCMGLEAKYDEHLEVILKLQDDVNSNLQRLLSFRDTWAEYDLMIDKLEFWMKGAEQDLNVISTQTIPPGGNMRQFWELKAQYEVHNNIHNAAAGTFESAIRIIPVADEIVQRQLNAELEERWKGVANRINGIQSSIVQNMSSQDVPINDKLSLLEKELLEVKGTIEDIHGVIKNEEELNLYIHRLQVLHGRVEQIQEELGRLGLLSATESEKVSALLSSARQLDIHVSEELEGSILLKEKLQAIQKGLARVKRNHQRANSVLDQCEASEKLGSEVVEQAVINCQAVAEELKGHWQDLMALRQLLHTLPMGLRLTVSPVKVEREISQLQDEHTAIEVRCDKLLGLLRSRLTLWRRFERQLEMVQQSVQEADYMMELLTVQGSVDYDRLLKATERLEGLYGSLDQREDLLDDLRAAAEPLASSCTPEVSKKIEAAVEEAVTAWNDTCQSLLDLCNRYQDAVRLWKQYREASEAVKAWADHQLDSVAQLNPEEALQQVKTLASHKNRLGELKGLVAQIAKDVGLEAGGILEAEVDALGKRLEDVRESLATLADSLTAVEDSNEKDVENQLGALRNHLVALSRTEGQLQNLKEKSVDLVAVPARQETSVVEILQLWQQVFRETFQQYHRLSARLVKSQDGAAALRLWQEYLHHVQLFLSGSIPDDYDSLTEHQHLCEVHQNLLTSQQTALLSKGDDPEGKLGRELVELSIAEQFNSLTNLHNETLSRIMERHGEVRERIAAWDRYRQDQARLLNWLRDTERERGKLQLRYIHTRRVPNMIRRINNLLDKVPNGESQADQLQDQQVKLLQFCDDALATSIRMEHAAITQRISNLQAGLETWKDFLNRVQSLTLEYEDQVKRIEMVFSDVHKTISDPGDLPLSHTGMQNRLENLKLLRTVLLDVTKDLEELGVTQEQLKECVSPMDMKTINQKVWLLWQSQGDLDHHLAVLCHQLEEKLGMRTLFDARQTRFLTWAKDVESRVEQGSSISGDPEEVLRRLETELQSEVALKSREVDWLLVTGAELVQASAGDGQTEAEQRREIEAKVEQVRETWDRLQNLSKTKANKLHDILQTMSQLEIRIAELRAWLYQVEAQLVQPLVFETCSKEVVESKLKEHEELQKTIERKSSDIADVLNLCELLLTDCEACKTTLNTDSISAATESLEKRWKNVCGLSAEKKQRIHTVWVLLQEVLKVYEEQIHWLESQEQILKDIDSRKEQKSQDEIQDLISVVEGTIREMESRGPALQILDQTYAKLLKDSGLELENLQQLTSAVRSMLLRWHQLTPNALRIMQWLHAELQVYRDFVTAHGRAVVCLTNIDVRLTQIQHLATPEEASLPVGRLEQIEHLETELESNTGLLRAADELGLIVMERSRPDELPSIQEMIDEYQLLYKDIKSRLSVLKSECKEDAQKKVLCRIIFCL